MKKTLYLISILLFFLSYNIQIPSSYAYDTSEIIKTIPLDEEHINFFNTYILTFINEKLILVKAFEDGDTLEQKLDSSVVVRIDVLYSGIERYIVNLKLSTKRFTPNNAQYTEEHIIQTVFFDILNNQLIDFYPFPAVELLDPIKLEI